MDIGDLLLGNSFCDQLTSQIVIDVGKLLWIDLIFSVHVLDHLKALALWRGQITEYKLCRTVFFSLFPDLINVLDTQIDLAPLIVGSIGVHKALVKCQFSAIVGNKQHIVLKGFHDPRVYLCRALGKLLHRCLLVFAWGCLFDVVDRLGYGEIEHIRRLHVGNLTEHGHQLGDIEKLCKPCFRAVAASVGRELDCRHCFPKGGCPFVKVGKPVEL